MWDEEEGRKKKNYERAREGRKTRWQRVNFVFFSLGELDRERKEEREKNLWNVESQVELFGASLFTGKRGSPTPEREWSYRLAWSSLIQGSHQ